MGARVVSLRPVDSSEARVNIINSIKYKYKKLRSRSKAPTFALTYAGQWTTLVKNCGFSEQEAKQIEANYHELYKESDAWMERKLRQAHKDGYATAAFGLRVRCPVMSRAPSFDKLSREAAAESRTLGNALGGQSYGLLNNRAMNVFMERVYASEYKYDIKPCALIHDAVYFMIRNRLGVIDWANRNLIECMEWCELPEIQHPEVKLGAELDLFLTWKDAYTIKNNATIAEIRDRCMGEPNSDD